MKIHMQLPFKLPPLKLRAKLMVFLILIVTVPIILINILWFLSARNGILRSATAQVEAVADRAEDEILSYFQVKQLSLISYSQTYAFINNELETANINLKSILKLDTDIQAISWINEDGTDILSERRERLGQSKEIPPESKSAGAGFKVALTGSNYISPVYSNAAGQPLVDIAIPTVTLDENQTATQLLNASHVARKDQITGVLIIVVDVSPLWQTLYALDVGTNGYVFVVDGNDNLLAHHLQNFDGKPIPLSQVPDTEKFISKLTDGNTNKRSISQVMNETSQSVIASYKHIDYTKWGVIAQVPTTETLAAINQSLLFAGILFLIFNSIILFLGVWMTNRIINPIEQLRLGSRHIGKGNLDYRINIKTGDETEELSNAFNDMATELQSSYKGLEAKVHERTQDSENAQKTLQEKVSELERLNSLMIGREVKMVELKDQISSLSKKPSDSKEPKK